MIKLDVTKLAQNLKKAEAEPDGDITQRDIHPYLLEHVILPYLNGKEVKMGMLNFSVFSAEDNKPGMEYRDLLEHLKDKDSAYYYSDILIPSGKNLQHFIKNI